MNSCRQIYPMELAAPTGLIESCKLRTYQKQSLAFMVNREKSEHDPDFVSGNISRKLFRRQTGKSEYAHAFSDIKTGLLCSEVGMGKSLVCIALVCANPGAYKRMSAEMFAKARSPVGTMDWGEYEHSPLRPPTLKSKYAHRAKRRRGSLLGAQKKELEEFNGSVAEKICVGDLETARYKVKTTVISTTNTIVGQWYDEIKKFAPSLTVKVHHGSYRQSPDFFDPNVTDLQDVDILLTVNTTAPPTWCARMTFHRVIVDEIHQYFLPYYHSRYVWGVTATPFEKLKSIFGKFGHQDSIGLGLGTKWIMQQRNPNALHQPFIDAMNTFMIRHTKDQEIQGKAALKLPPMPKTSIEITLTPNEKSKYLGLRSAITLTTYPTALTAVGIDQTLSRIRSATLCKSKLAALRKDYHALLETNPSASIVIFSRFTASIDALQKFFQNDFPIATQGFFMKQSTTAKKRQDAIRSFQDPTNTRPKVFAISYKTGQCGITLTAASRVYLLEPCILPSDEIQAGGRISRLGQTKNIALVRLVAKGTCDEAIISMHAKLASGATKFTEDGKLPYSCIAAMLKIGSDGPPPITFKVNKLGSCRGYRPGWTTDSTHQHETLTLEEQQSLPTTQTEMFSKLCEIFPIIMSEFEGERHALNKPPIRGRRTYRSLSDRFLSVVNIVKSYTNERHSLIGTNHEQNMAWAALYGTNPLSEYTQEVQNMYGPRTCLTFEASWNTERPKVLKFLKSIAKYGDPVSSIRICQVYAKALKK